MVPFVDSVQTLFAAPMISLRDEKSISVAICVVEKSVFFPSCQTGREEVAVALGEVVERINGRLLVILVVVEDAPELSHLCHTLHCVSESQFSAPPIVDGWETISL